MLNLWRRAMQGQKKGDLPPLPSGYTAVKAIKRQGDWFYFQTIYWNGPMTEVAKIEGNFKGNTFTYGPIVYDNNSYAGPQWNSFLNSSTKSMTPPITVSDFAALNDFMTITFATTTPIGNSANAISQFISRNVWMFEKLSWKYLKVWNFNDELISYLQPCVRDVDGKVGYYDLVQNEFRSSTSADQVAQWVIDTNA